MLVDGGCDAVWKTAQAALRHRLGEVRTMRWLPALVLVSLDRDRARAVLAVESSPAQAAATAHRAAIIEELEAATGLARLDVRVVRAGSDRAIVASSKTAPRAARAARMPSLDTLASGRLLDLGLDGEPPLEPEIDDVATLEAPEDEALPQVDLEADRWNQSLELKSFIVGRSTAIAHMFAQRIVDAPGEMNRVVFHGGSGSGKSHLIQAIATEYARRWPGRRIAYASSERFASQFSLATRRRGNDAARFRELYRRADLLVIDDVHLLAGKTATEQELLHTIDELDLRGAQFVAASAASPKQIARLDRGLMGRLIQGLVIDLPDPDEATRLQLVKARAAALGFTPDDEVARLLAAVEGSARDVLGAVGKVEAHARLLGARADARTAREVLGELLKAREEAPTPDVIVGFVASELGVDPKSVRGIGRKSSVVRARQVSMALMRWLTPLTLREIGDVFNKRSPACVHFAQSRVRSLKEEEPRVRALIEAALRRFRRPRQS